MSHLWICTWSFILAWFCHFLKPTSYKVHLILHNSLLDLLIILIVLLTWEHYEFISSFLLHQYSRTFRSGSFARYSWTILHYSNRKSNFLDVECWFICDFELYAMRKVCTGPLFMVIFIYITKEDTERCVDVRYTDETRKLCL